ncbi:MAG: hypothetical protein MR998_03700 [Lachnospiraceae bacterium]|nr:hypothetical protein [Lachnospiraceae bacterium]
MNELFLKLVISLLLTLVTEFPVAFLFQAKGKDLLLVFLVNILTNPAVVLVSTLTGDRVSLQMILEGMAILAEGFYYNKYSTYMRKGFLCSFCCNLVSYGAGLLL